MPALVTAESALTLSDLSPMIAAELAAGLSEPSTIRDRYGLTQVQWKALASNPSFRQMLAEALAKFKGDLNAGNRITLKAEILLEDALPELHHLAKANTTAAADKINAIKQLADLSGRNVKQQLPGSGGGGFVLNINLSGKQGLTIEGQKELPSADGS